MSIELFERIMDENRSPNVDLVKENKLGTTECDFDVNPTTLYSFIQQKQWAEAEVRAASFRNECSTWVSRREPDGKLRWRLLPLHAAIIFKAPETTIEQLLLSFPASAQCKDDQGMLPIHLAFRNGIKDTIASMLLMSYPKSIHVEDRKGRIPLIVAQASTCEYKEAYLHALEWIPRYASVGTKALACNVPSNNSSGDLMSPENLAIDLLRIRQEAETNSIAFQNKITELETELTKTQAASQVLVEHVNTLEAQLSTRSDTERFLASKIANLDSGLKDASRNKELLEAHMKSSISELEKENESLKTRCAVLEDELSLHTAKLTEEKQNLADDLKTTFDSKNKFEVRCKQLELELAQAAADSNVLEAQLKKKNIMEQTLASQVSSLAEKLAESAASTNAATNTYVKRIEQLEAEKAQLKKTTVLLTEKLLSISKRIEQMEEEKEKASIFAARYDDKMFEVIESHKHIMANAARQEQILIDAAREREQIVYILTRQAEEIERTNIEREKIADAIKQHTEKMKAATKDRDEMESILNIAKAALNDMKEGIKQICSQDNEQADSSFPNVGDIVTVIDTDTVSAEIATIIDTYDDTVSVRIEENSDTQPSVTVETSRLVVEDDKDVALLVKAAEDVVATVNAI